MGLNTTHDCWNGSYSGFNSFRRAIAKAVGIPLPLMHGFLDAGLLALIRGTKKGDEAAEFLPVPWTKFRDDPICYLLDHSDCEGSIAFGHLTPLADRLAEIAPSLAAPHREDAERFVGGLQAAAALGQPVEFH